MILSSYNLSKSFILSPAIRTHRNLATLSVLRSVEVDGCDEIPATKRRLWFPVKPQDALLNQYNTIVKGAYVRHVLVETEDMADVAIKTYLKGDMDSQDPFGLLASDLSACSLSRDEGGKVGWIMNPFHISAATQTNEEKIRIDHNSNVAVYPLISEYAIEQLFEVRPKGGDVFKIPSSLSSNRPKWHICRIDDLLLDYLPNSGQANLESDSDLFTDEMDKKGTNKVFSKRPKLKGSGTLPKTPNIIIPTSATSIDPKRPIAKTYQIITNGCQMNVADSERLEGVLQKQLNLLPIYSSTPQEDALLVSTPSSTKSTSDSKSPDIIVINTCTIRDHAEQKVYNALGPYAARKRAGKAIAIVVAGCVAQQEGENLLRRVPEVDLVMGPQYVNRLADLLDDVSRGHQVVATDPTLLTEDLSRPIRGHKVRAWVNIIHGCNEHCTYCVVPGTRGVEQSRSMEHVLKECLDLASLGYKEITLLGQNIDAYGRDMTPKRTFADLLHYLNDHIPSGTIERIRYVTSHPRYFSDRVIDAVASLDKVCECFHMPFQSGDDEILRKMRRGYTFDSYMKIIQKIRDRAPDASICGDVIVGFPGETDDAFQRTLDLMNAVRFDNLNTFAYSPRPNTEAALWEKQVPDDVKSERLQIVQRLSTQHALERSERYLGKRVEVLVEDRNPKHIGQVMGRTRQNRQVFFEGDFQTLEGKVVHVDITEARPWSLTGILV